MKTLITSTFKRSAKRLHRNQITVLEKAIESIQKDPFIGELKKADLSGVRVYKFHMAHQLILLAYVFYEDKRTVELLSFAPHENFYDKLKKQLH